MSAPQIISSETLVAAGGAVGLGGMELGRRVLVAARAGDTAGVRALLARGAPLAADWLGTSPLHLAAAHAHADTARVLLRAGVSRDARTKTERTPLHVAAAAGHARVAQELLEAGAAVDARDMLRMTPLHWAAQRAHAAVAALLVRHGADASALSKFLKTPLALARAHPPVLQALQDALREREEARAHQRLRPHDEDMSEDAAESSDLEPVRAQRAQAQAQEGRAGRLPAAARDKKGPKAETIKTEEGSGGGGGGVGGGGAAQLLRAHGITLLPADDGSTVLSALQSGRTVVLSDAGKLLLKESRSATGVGAVGGGGGAGGVVLTATPATSPPAPGVKVFTLQPRAPRPPRGPRARRTPARAPQQAKLTAAVALSAGAGAASPAVGVGGAGGAERPTVKIIMNRANLQKLISTATRAHEPPPGAQAAVRVALQGEADGGGEGEEESVVVVPEQFVRSESPHYLRSQLLCAHAALHAMAAQLRAARARLARYEP